MGSAAAFPEVPVRVSVRLHQEFEDDEQPKLESIHLDRTHPGLVEHTFEYARSLLECRGVALDRPSKGNRLRENVLPNSRAQSRLGDEVDGEAQDVAQFHQEAA